MKSAVQQKELTGPELFLRIKHPSIRPAAMTQSLGIEPEHTVEAGRAESQAGVQRLHSESYWLGRLEATGHGAGPLGAMAAAPRALPALAAKTATDFRDATSLDIWILQALQPLLDRKDFVRDLKRGGSVTLLLQRAELSIPLSLNRSLGVLAELGITLEID
jgi:hypothetical protein